MTKLKVCFEVEGEEVNKGVAMSKEIVEYMIMYDWDEDHGGPHYQAKTEVRNLKVEEIE